jgi:hypothetical protein
MHVTIPAFSSKTTTTVAVLDRIKVSQGLGHKPGPLHAASRRYGDKSSAPNIILRDGLSRGQELI